VLLQDSTSLSSYVAASDRLQRQGEDGGKTHSSLPPIFLDDAFIHTVDELACLK
jgi:hypothetical protein